MSSDYSQSMTGVESMREWRHAFDDIRASVSKNMNNMPSLPMNANTDSNSNLFSNRGATNPIQSTGTNEFAIPSSTNNVKTRLIDEQMKIMETSQPKVNWLKESIQKPIVLAIVSFVVTALLLISLEPPFVLKEPEQELEKMKIDFSRVIVISFIVSVTTYTLPFFLDKRKLD